MSDNGPWDIENADAFTPIDGVHCARAFRSVDDLVVFSHLEIVQALCDICLQNRPSRRCEGRAFSIPCLIGGREIAMVADELWMCADCDDARVAADALAISSAFGKRLAQKGITAPDAELRSYTNDFLRHHSAAHSTRLDLTKLDYAYTRREGLDRELVADLSRQDDSRFFFDDFGHPAVSNWQQYRDRYRARYGYAMPNAVALDEIAANASGGIVEIGAGNGYWAHLLRKRGVDVVAVDRYPISSGRNPNWDHLPQEFVVSAWTEIKRGGIDALFYARNRTFLSVWPPPGDTMIIEAIRKYRGDTFLYVGEEGYGSTGHRDLPRELALWRMAKRVRIPTGFGLRDELFVYRR